MYASRVKAVIVNALTFQILHVIICNEVKYFISLILSTFSLKFPAYCLVNKCDSCL